MFKRLLKREELVRKRTISSERSLRALSKSTSLLRSGKSTTKGLGLLMSFFSFAISSFFERVFSNSVSFNEVPNRKQISKSFVLVIAVLFTFFGEGWGQITPTTWDFNANSTGWTGNITRTTQTTACGSASMRRNLWASATTGNMVSPQLSGTNTGGVVTISYKYKAANWSANTVGTNPWGSFNVQWGPSATGPWTTFATVSQETQNGSCITKTHTFSPTAGPLFIKWDCFWTAGDYYINFDDVVISQEPLQGCTGTPAVPVTSGGASICQGQNIALSATGFSTGSGLVNQWMVSTTQGGPYSPVSGATNNSLTLTNLPSGVYYYVNQSTCNNNNSSSTSNEQVVTVNALPQISISATNNGAFCGTGYLTASGAANYVWSPANSLIVPTGSTVQSTATAPTTFTVSGTNAAGCIGTATQTITYTPSAPIDITASIATFCGQGGTTTLTANSSGTYDYTWSALDGATLSATSGMSTDATVSQTSAVLVSGVDNTTGCYAFDIYSVSVYPLPTATLTTSANGVCPGGSAITINSGLTAGSFSSASIPHAPLTAPATATTLCTGGVGTPALTSYDDGGWSNIPVGFDFKFFGTLYNSITIGTNGTLFFGSGGNVNDFTFSTLPSTSEPFNMVAVLAMDNNLSGANGGTIKYWVEGYAPNRKFVVHYIDVKEYGDNKFSTAQAIFYETTGIIEVHVTYSTNVDRNKLVGINNSDGTLGALAYASGTTASPINPITNPFAYRFTPPSNYTTIWTATNSQGSTELANGTNIFTQSVTPLETTTYSISYTNSVTGCTNPANSAEATISIIGTTAPSGVVTQGPASVCPGSNISLTTNYTGVTTGLTYQWQVSTDAGTTWSDISGATSATATTTQTQQSVYRCAITSCGGTADYSSELTVGMSSFFVCYCPTTNAGTSLIDEVSVVGTSTYVNNTAASNPTTSPFYTFTNAGPSIEQGEQVNLTILNGGSASIISVWIDYNQNGTFEASEWTQVATNVAANATASASILVPINALTGLTGMRIRSRNTGTTNDATSACISMGSGETEDYLVNILPGQPCAGTPTPGNTLASLAAVTPNGATNLSLQNSTSGLGVSYQWQSSLDNINWTDISGATSATYAASGIASPTYYRCNVSCDGSTGTSTEILIGLTYCTPTTTYGCTDGDVIAKVVLNTLVNESGTGCPSGLTGYSDYTSNTAFTTTLLPSTNYSCIVSAGQYSEGYAAWIDYNDNFIFETNERIGYSNGTVAGSGQAGVLGSSATFPVVISCNPPAGPHRMRVRAMYATSGINVTPCDNNSYGEIEDYIVTIAPAPACPSPGMASVSATTYNSVSLSWPLGCSTATNYDFEFGPTGFTLGSGTQQLNVPVTIDNATNTASVTLTGLNPETTYELYYNANCGANGTSLSSLPVYFATTIAPCSGTPTPGNTIASLAAVAPNGSTDLSLENTTGLNAVYQWQSSLDNVSWTDISGATSATYTASGIASPTYYRCNVSCDGNIGSSTEILIAITYCTPAPSSVDGSGITNVAFGANPAVNNASVAETNNYGDYTSLLGGVVAGQPTAVDITFETGSWDYETNIWVDLNNNYVFETTELLYNGVSSLPNPTTLNAMITIPVATLPGNYRMRIGGTDLGTTDPCYTGDWGSYEDYTLAVSSCPSPSVSAVSNAVNNTICSGSSVEFTASATNAGTTPTYQWYKNGTAISGASSATYTSATLLNSDEITVEVTSVCGTALSNAVVINVNTIVDPAFTQLAAICSGASLSALPTTSNNGIDGTWSPALDNTATTTYTFTPAAGSCASSMTMVIVVNALPVISVGASPEFICAGASSTLTATGASSYNWIGASSNSESVVVSPSTTTTYLVEGTQNGCTVSQSITITVDQPVAPLFDQVAAICSGASLSALPTTSNNGIDGTWSPALDNTTTTPYTFTPAAGLCASTATMEIVVNPVVVPTFTQVAPVCSGAPLAALPVTSTNGVSGTWSPSTMNNTNTTVYTFTPSSGCSASTQMTIGVIAAPVLSTNANIICTGIPVVLTPSVSTGLTWQRQAVGSTTWSPVTNTNPTLTISSASSTTTGTYRVSSSQCPSLWSNSVAVSAGVVTATPTMSLTSPSLATCVGGSVSFAANTGVTNPSYQWFKATAAIPGATSATYTVNASATTAAGAYNVKVTEAGKCPSLASASQTVVVNALPATPLVTVAVVGTTPVLCGSTGVTIKSSVAPASTAQLQWFLNGTAIVGATAQNYTATAPGTYTVQVTNPVTTCSGAMSANFIIQQGVVPNTPNVSITSGNSVLCGTATVTLSSDVAASSTTTLKWYKGTTLIPTATGTSYTITGGTTAAGSYSVVATAVGGCVSGTSNAIAVTYFALPATPTISLVGSTYPVLCGTTGVTLKSSIAPTPATATPVVATLQWYKDGQAIAGATAQNYVATEVGSYRVQVTNPTTGCSGLMSAATVVTVGDVPSAPVATASGATLLCGTGAQVTLSSSVAASGSATTPGSITLQWYKSVTNATTGVTTVTTIPAASFGTNQTILLAGSTPTGSTNALSGITYSGTSVPGSYTVRARLIGGCLSDASNAISATYSALPAVSNVTTTTAGASTVLCGTPISLKSSLAASATVLVQWYKDGQLIPGATGTNYSASTAGSYTVVTSNVAGCSAAAGTALVLTQGVAAATPVITASGSTTLCGTGAQVTLSSSVAAQAGTTLQWYKNGAAVTGGTATTLSVLNTATNAGSYTVKVLSQAGGCPSALSAATSITTGTAPTTAPTINIVTSAGVTSTVTVLSNTTPTIYLKSSVIPVTGTATVAPVILKWYKDGVEMTSTVNLGLTNQTIAVTSAGSYTVRAFYGTSLCQGNMSAARVITGTSPLGIDLNNNEEQEDATSKLDTELTWDAAVSRNPYEQYVTIRLNSESDSDIELTMVDAMGKVVSHEVANIKELGSTRIGEGLTPGMYLISIRQDENIKTIRVIKQ